MTQKVPPTTVAPTYKLTLPSEFVLTHMPDMMNGDFGMISADGTQSFSVSIVPRCAGAAVVWVAHGCSIYLASVKSHDMLLCRRNKDKFEYTVQAKAWKQVSSTDLQMHVQGMHIAMPCRHNPMDSFLA